jgi:hypothetical protein
MVHARRSGTNARFVVWTLIGLAVGPSSAATAQVPQSRADSLEAEVRRLRARLDSLAALVARLTPAQRDTSRAVDELSALRAAARAAVADSSPTEGTSPSPSVGANLNRLNPEISATGDVRVQMDPDVPDEQNVEVREFEFSFQAALDPYAKTKIFLAASDEGVEVEEGYAYWSGLPGGVRLELGRFRQQVGELNRWHPHSLPESEWPLVLREYFGEEGLRGDGLGLYWTLPFGGGALGTYELWAQGTLADNEVLFGGGRHLSGLAHLNVFWEAGPAVFFQVGGTVLAGSNPDSNLTTHVFGADFRLSWRPPARALYRSFTIRGEAYAQRREVSGVVTTFTGAYASAQLQLSRRLFGGLRADAVEPLGVPAATTWALVPALTWWQSEWVYLRLEWQHQRDAIPGGGHQRLNRLVLQTVWAIGPHKHETY